MSLAQKIALSVLAIQEERIDGCSPAQIRRLIQESEAIVSALDLEIAALEFKLKELFTQRERECAANAALRHLIAPVRSLPVELLTEIFVLSMHDESSDHAERRNSCIPNAYRISHVCSEWRSIAMGTPELWDGPLFVDLAFPFPSKFEEGLYVEGLRTWLARSDPLSISVTLTLGEGWWMWNSNNHYSQRCVAEVLQVASRWRSVHFPLETPSFFFRELEGMGPLSFLEELEMPEFVPDDLKFDHTSISCFSTASRLRKLTMESNCPIAMPWTQLTDITLLSDSISPDAALDIFSQCTHLVRASVSSPPWYDTPTRSMVQLDYLRSLEIRFTDTALHNIWDYLSAPVLDDLGLFHEPMHLAGIEAPFTTFQLRSPNITKLGIHAPFPPEALKTIFLHSPSVTHSALGRMSGLDSYLLQALTYKADDPQPLLSRLHSLSVSGISFAGNEEILASMIASRRWSDAELALRCTAPPAIVQWSEVILGEGGLRNDHFEYSSSFRNKMDDLRRTGLPVTIVSST